MSPDHPARILVVEDEPAVARVMAALLRKSGCDVVVAGSPTDAMERLSEPFDALVLDLRLPEMRGDVFYNLAVLRQPALRESTLFVSGDLSEQSEDVIRATGRPMLAKPFSGRELLAAVAAILPPSVARLPRVS